MGDAPPTSAAAGLKGVLCAGNIVHDLIVHPVDRLIWGTSSWVESLESRLGGNGANTAYTLAVLGIPVRLLSTGRRAIQSSCCGPLNARDHIFPTV